ncbi:hypothetical protein [Oxobacter pfennigii]|nr:hypothetical protein [Oxobacter pfennigii]
MTTQEQLNQINNAVAAIENGAQEYRIGSRMVRKADLSVLYQERRRLQQQLNEENSGSTFVAKFDRR